MKKYSFAFSCLNQIRTVARKACLVGAVLSGLVGCADTHWERAFYQGARYGTEQCQLKRKPADVPCTELGDYDSYERARAKAKIRSNEGKTQ